MGWDKGGLTDKGAQRQRTRGGLAREEEEEEEEKKKKKI